MRRLIWLGVVAFTAMLTTAAQAERRVALVIGNDQYQNLPKLEKAVADARSYADVLKAKGFDQVTLETDLTRSRLDEAVAAFLASIEPGDIAVFAYSGHGWSDGTQNYIVGTDAPAAGTQDLLARISIPLKNGVNGIIDEMDQKGAKLKVAIIDACRDNPFTPPAGKRSIGLSRGMARIDPPHGTFVVFSAGAGQSALDRLSDNDLDPNSVFTRVFITALRADMTLQEAVKRTQEQVVALARSIKVEQNPAYYDEVIGSACLSAECNDAVASKARPAEPANTQLSAEGWRHVGPLTFDNGTRYCQIVSKEDLGIQIDEHQSYVFRVPISGDNGSRIIGILSKDPTYWGVIQVGGIYKFASHFSLTSGVSILIAGNDDHVIDALKHSEELYLVFPDSHNGFASRILEVRYDDYLLKFSLSQSRTDIEWLKACAEGGSNLWTKYYEDSEAEYYIQSSIVRQGNFIRLWVLYDYKQYRESEDKRYRSVVLEQLFDCSKNQIQLISGAQYSEKMMSGRKMDDYTFKNPKWESIRSDTLVERERKAACK
jgi:hypothetical protein